MSIFSKSGKWIYNRNDISSNLKDNQVQVITDWINNEAIPDKTPLGYKKVRRKALLICSAARGIGKTYWAENKVFSNHDEIMIFRQRLCAFEKKDYKLLILDDIDKEDILNNLETYKQLITGQRCQIYTKYCNQRWEYNIPCIMLSNDLEIMLWFLNNSAFKNQAYIVRLMPGESMAPTVILEDATSPVELATGIKKFDTEFDKI